MKKISFIFCGALIALLPACGSKNNGNESNSDSAEGPSAGAVAVQTIDSTPIEATPAVDSVPVVEEEPKENHAANEAVIRKVYKTFVFGYSESSPKKYFTPKALKSMAASYEYDCDQGPCYAYWDLRTGHQDGPGASRIKSITPIDGKEGWYRVEYLDMGHEGVTDIKMKDGKIDDYKFISSKEHW